MRKKVKTQESLSKVPTWIWVLLDSSGSMASVQNKTISGLNEFMQDRRKEAQTEDVKIWEAQFSSDFKLRVAGVDPREIRNISTKDYVPSGSTALFDAVNRSISSLLDEESRSGVKPKILVLIITDGEENSSKFMKAEGVKSLIQSCEAKGNWTFIYMGANQDSWANSNNLGILATNTINFSNDTVSTALRGVSKAASKSTYSKSYQQTAMFNTSIGQLQNAEDLDKMSVDVNTGDIIGA